MHDAGIQFNTSIAGDLIVTGINPFVQVGSFPGSWRNKTDVTEKDLQGLNKYNVDGDITIKDIKSGGNIKVSGKIGGYVNIEGEAVEFWANEIDEGLNCSSGSNEIRIFGSLGTITSTNTCEIDSGYGTLFINNCYTKLNATVDKGGITINNAFNDVNIENNNSDTYVGFSNNVSDKKLTVLNKHGNIIAKNITGKAELTAETGSVTAEFLKVASNNKIIAKYNATVKVLDGQTFELTTKAKSADVNVKLGSVKYTNWDGAETVDGWKVKTDKINDNGLGIADTLFVQVTDNGKIQIGF